MPISNGRFLTRPLIALSALFTLGATFGCNNAKTATSAPKSDWETAEAINGLRTYAVDWSCEPKRFGEVAETKFADQDEYCEWKTKSKTATEKTCVFTTSFDETRSFHLNSRGVTPVNSISAARQLVEDCNGIALTRLNSGKTAGNLCSGISSGCVAARNSDPEICDKVRFVTGEKFAGNIDFCVDQLSQRDSITTPRPLMQFGILTDIPENCVYSADDHTEVTCTVPVEDTCFSVAGQLRPGLRVITKAKGAATSPSTSGGTATTTAAALPSTRECYVP